MRLGALFTQRYTLLNTEAMLLINDGEHQILEVDMLLDDGMCSDQHLGLPAGNRSENCPFRLSREPSGEQPDGGWLNAKWVECLSSLLEERSHILRVLLCENLGGRHQCRLAALEGGQEERAGRDRGLARTNLALN